MIPGAPAVRSEEGDIQLAYGRGRLAVPMPAGAEPWMIRKPRVEPIDDVASEVQRSLEDPVGCPSLATLARGRKSACIVVCDITRPVPNHCFLRPLIETIVSQGVPLEAVTVLIATGLHRPNLGSDLEEVIGDRWVLENVRIENHDARNRATLVTLGPTATRGTPVTLNRSLVEADLRIVSGLVEPHFMAGWSGGRKVVAPGVAGEDTIRTFHSYRFMADPLAVQCNLEGNPLHQEQLEIIKALGEVYALNTVIDDDRRLLKINFGDVVLSHLSAVEFAERFAKVDVGRRFSTVLTSAGGYPLDKTYYQSVKGMVTPLDILEPGGTLIIASECSEGFGSDAYLDAQRRLMTLGPDAFLQRLASKAMADIDEWQSQMQLRSQRETRVQLFTENLSSAERRLTGVEVLDDIAVALDDSMRRSADPGLAVIPDGPYVVPVGPQDPSGPPRTTEIND